MFDVITTALLRTVLDEVYEDVPQYETGARVGWDGKRSRTRLPCGDSNEVRLLTDKTKEPRTGECKCQKNSALLSGLPEGHDPKASFSRAPRLQRKKHTMRADTTEREFFFHHTSGGHSSHPGVSSVKAPIGAGISPFLFALIS